MSRNRNQAWWSMSLLLGLAMPGAQAQQAAPSASAATPAPAQSAAPAQKKRSAFGEAMARLTGALKEASQDAAQQRPAPPTPIAHPSDSAGARETTSAAAVPGGVASTGAASGSTALASDTPPEH